jgi:hypothetical protein
MIFRSILFSLLIYAGNSFGQCATRIHVSRADSLFNLQITKDNFRKGIVFLTLDTINMSDIYAPSNFLETENPELIIKNYKRFMKSLEIEGSYYNYYELFNSPFFDSPLHISYIINTKDASYLVRIWTDKDNTSKIEGITVGKCEQKMERTPW